MNRKTAMGLIVAAFALWFIFFSGGPLHGANRAQDVYDSLKTFSDVLTLVQSNFVDEVDPKTLIQDAIQGMVSRLDPHSGYMPPDVYKEMQVETKGSFGGVGLEITIRDDVLTVVAPIEDSPAFNAGIKTGDKITKIDNEPAKNMSMLDAVKKMRGKPDSILRLSIMREGFSEPKVFTLKRDVIKIKCVKVRKLDDQFYCIRISQFQETTADEFRKAVKNIRAEIPALKGIVLDMRGNPGGLLDQAVKIADEFIDEGLIVSTEGRNESQKMQFSAKKDISTIACPIVVLVNGGSASAAEIVAGALQDHNKAILVGTQTFGKGTVQTIYPLSDGSGLRITTAKYYTPNHRSIQEKGITPDVTVEDTLDIFIVGDKKAKTVREKDLVSQFKKGGSGHDETPDEKAAPDSLKEQQAVSGPQPTKVKDDSQEIDKPMDTAVSILKNWETFRKTLGKKNS
jgi:carboxyl-terminal processing protease